MVGLLGLDHIQMENRHLHLLQSSQASDGDRQDEPNDYDGLDVPQHPRQTLLLGRSLDIVLGLRP
jgi:hypothetical protein